MTELLIDLVLLVFLGATGLAILRLRSLFAVVMLSGLYSFLAATIFVLLDAVDVAFTEAAVGAGVSGVLMIATLSLVRREAKPPVHSPLLPLITVTITGAALVYATFDMPAFGDPEAPAQEHVAPRYLADADPANTNPQRVGLPNVVTSVLASYRGFDTLGEVAVVFTAGVGVMLLLGSRRRRRVPEDGGPDAGAGDESAGTAPSAGKDGGAA